MLVTAWLTPNWPVTESYDSFIVEVVFSLMKIINDNYGCGDQDWYLKRLLITVEYCVSSPCLYNV